MPDRWWEASPHRWQWELDAMAEVAPELEWSDQLGGWRGLAPVWPFERAAPPELDGFLGGRRFSLEVVPRSAHPAVAPRVWPIDPMPELAQCTLHRWHVNGDGSICQLQDNYTWSGAEPCAALVPKASGWFLEYLLMTAERIESMTVAGIETSSELDHLFTTEPAAP